MKTIEEHLNTLPEPQRSQAFENTIALNNEPLLEEKAETTSGALYAAFRWDNSPEGHEYWVNIVKDLETTNN
jgi:hypothetical protein